MKWSAQVMHVARKDLRHARWSLMTYVAAAAAVAASLCYWPRGASSGAWGILLIPLVMIIAASLVQGDSPSRVDAFWATRPLSPSAVATAKLVGVSVGILLPGLVLQLAVTLAFDLPRGTILGLLWNSFLAQTSLLLTAMAIAALTRDLRAFIIALVVVFVLEQLTIALPWRSTRPMIVGDALFDLVTLVSIVAIGAITFYQYRSRDLRVGRVLGVAVAIATSVVMPPVARSTMGALSVRAEPVGVATAFFDPRVDPRNVTVVLDVPGRAGGDRVTIIDTRVTTVGSKVWRDTVTTPSFAVLNQPALDIGRNVNWLRRSQLPSDAPTLRFSIDDDKLTAVLDGRAKLMVEGLVAVARPVPFAELRPDSGVTVGVSGARFTLLGMKGTSQGYELTMAKLTLDTDQRTDLPGYALRQAAYSYALVNDARGEAVELSEAGSSGGSTIPPMPGVSLYTGRMTLRTDGPFPGQKAPIDDEWIRGSHLVIVGWQRQELQRVAVTIIPRPTVF